MKSKRPTQEDVAQRAGVSRGTVSLVLNVLLFTRNQAKRHLTITSNNLAWPDSKVIVVRRPRYAVI